MVGSAGPSLPHGTVGATERLAVVAVSDSLTHQRHRDMLDGDN